MNANREGSPPRYRDMKQIIIARKSDDNIYTYTIVATGVTIFFHFFPFHICVCECCVCAFVSLATNLACDFLFLGHSTHQFECESVCLEREKKIRVERNGRSNAEKKEKPYFKNAAIRWKAYPLTTLGRLLFRMDGSTSEPPTTITTTRSARFPVSLPTISHKQHTRVRLTVGNKTHIAHTVCIYKFNFLLFRKIIIINALCCVRRCVARMAAREKAAESV